VAGGAARRTDDLDGHRHGGGAERDPGAGSSSDGERPTRRPHRLREVASLPGAARTEPAVAQKDLAAHLNVSESAITYLLAPRNTIPPAQDAYRQGQVTQKGMVELSKAPPEDQPDLLAPWWAARPLRRSRPYAGSMPRATSHRRTATRRQGRLRSARVQAQGNGGSPTSC